MAGEERFDLKKLLSGFINPVTWSKTVVYMAIMAIIIISGITIYRAYFIKNNQQKTEIHVAAGGTANITNVQNQDKKRKWWMPIPYISIFGEARGSSRTSFNDMDYGYGGQAGIRWDF